jgi:hypothetical protein
MKYPVYVSEFFNQIRIAANSNPVPSLDLKLNPSEITAGQKNRKTL